MEKKNIDWGNLGFGYMPTDKRFVANYKNGAWDEGALIDDPMITMSECACVLQYAQTCFEGIKAYTTEQGKIVTFRPDLNAKRMADAGISGRSFCTGSCRCSKSKCSICTALWKRSNAVYSSVYVWY